MKQSTCVALCKSPRLILLIVAIVCALLLVFAYILQHQYGLDPCPMCIVQRYAFFGVGIAALLGCLGPNRWWQALWSLLGALSGLFGGYVAVRQSILQIHPPEFSSCGRDFYSIVNNFPLSRAIPMLFKGSGDCAAVEWRFLGLTIANWSLVWFVICFIVLLYTLCLALRCKKAKATA